ncbi:MAG: hypothetical protein HQM03_00680 [Magnetococcales bacterium]|nr:hypothetical protein [Magnetococcales bacterium]
MNTSPTLAAMLALVEEKKRQQQDRILAQARTEADALIADAHRQARARMHEAILAERRMARQALQATQTRQETELRGHAMNVANRQLRKGRLLLENALLERWRNPESQRAWIAGLAERALACLPAGQWEVWHPSGLASGALDPLREKLRQAGGPDPEAREEAGMTAGLRIACQGAWVDGTATGLMADRMAIDAMLLALLQPEGASK